MEKRREVGIKRLKRRKDVNQAQGGQDSASAAILGWVTA